MPNPAIILVNTQMGENIGAAARVMKNFGFSDLRIVTPECDWPNEKAQAMSVGAVDIVDGAEVFEDLSAALSDIEYLFAATVRKRDMIKHVVYSDELRVNMPANLKTGIIFGGERSGLANDEVAIADKIITIATNKACSSLNLAQSVAVLCYEIQRDAAVKPVEMADKPATKSEIIGMTGHLVAQLDRVNYFRADNKRDGMIETINNMLSKTGWTHQEVRSFRGFIRSLGRNSPDK